MLPVSIFLFSQHLSTTNSIQHSLGEQRAAVFWIDVNCSRLFFEIPLNMPHMCFAKRYCAIKQGYLCYVSSDTKGDQVCLLCMVFRKLHAFEKRIFAFYCGFICCGCKTMFQYCQLVLCLKHFFWYLLVPCWICKGAFW